MRHRRDELSRGVAWQTRVRVERDDVTHALEEISRRRHDRERRLGVAAEESVQLLELAALSLPPEPRPIACILHAFSVKEHVPLLAGMIPAPVELGDAFA